MQAINDYVSTLEIINSQTFNNLTVNVVRGRDYSNLNIRSFADAIADNSLRIREVGDNGNVPELLFRNDDIYPVFVSEGSIIEGLRQNRTVRTSFVIEPHAELVVPVYCVEHGRWVENSKMGRKSAYHLDTRSRVLNLRKSDQGEMWDNISDRMSGTGTKSRTGYVGDIYEHSRKNIEAYQRAFICPDHAVGFVAQIDGQVVALDVFANNNLMVGNFHPLLAGLCLDSTDREYRRLLSTKKGLTVREFLKAIEDAPKEKHDGIGQGHIIQFESKLLIGNALDFENKFIHMEAFAV